MKAIMIMFDSLNRNYLSPYGCRWTYTPNFMRLAKKSVTFDTCYAGSLPCMPARRELHTGRYNFLHRSWGPMEPFDDSVPEILRTNGVYTHLISDHQHYWEDGGATYHTRYSSWEITRGQEGDPWKSTPELIRLKNQHEGECEKSDRFNEKQYAQDKVNRQFMKREGQLPQKVTFERGIEFIKRNHSADSWFLQIETFDPHEPFVPLALVMALILSKKPRGWKFFRTVYFLPQVISGIAIASLWSAVYNSEFGLLNGLLRAVGLDHLAKNWLGNPDTALPCVILYGLFYIGYYMVIMMAGITGVDYEYYEAAKIDGANRLQMDLHITIPLIKYSIMTCTTLAAVFSLRTFEQVFQLTNGGPANRTSVVVLYLYNQMKNNDYGGANASSVMLILVGAVVIVCVRKIFTWKKD